jgi:hypothetical protein
VSVTVSLSFNLSVCLKGECKMAKNNPKPKMRIVHKRLRADLLDGINLLAELWEPPTSPNSLIDLAMRDFLRKHADKLREAGREELIP